MLTGDFAALTDFYSRLKKLGGGVSAEIAKNVSPKVEALVNTSFASQSSPEGAGWPATKSGKPAFGGGDSGGRVFVRLVGKATIKSSVLYPLHFHNAGTHRVGRKRAAAIRKAITGVASKAAASGIKVPRKRKDESPFAYQQRLAIMAARRAARSEAVKSVKHRASFAVQEARAKGGWHDPPRPMIPENDIPPSWEKTIKDAAREVMAKYGATEKR